MDEKAALIAAYKQDIRTSQEKLNLHQKAELYESRINDAIDGYENFHPAESAGLAASLLALPKKKVKLNAEENERFNNYALNIPNTKIPLFWPSRPWDLEENKMSQKESTELQYNIFKWNQIPEESKFTFHNFSEGPLCKHIDTELGDEDTPIFHSIRISIKEHITDDYDTDTELI